MPIKNNKNLMIVKKVTTYFLITLMGIFTFFSTIHAETNKSPPKKWAVSKINKANIKIANLPNYLLTQKEKHLVNFIHKTVATTKYSTYKLGGSKIDRNNGVYIVDCSRYVNYILKTIYPIAYTSLINWSGNERPTTQDFYLYFSNLTEDSVNWNAIDDVEKLRPGDVLVFRKNNATNGHVMVVMDKPIQEGNTFLVRIADSAPARHSDDTRMPRTSGIGIGTILLKVDPDTYQPYAYAWREGARWKNVKFAMARPKSTTA